MKATTEGLIAMLKGAVSPFHCIKTAEDMLKESGFLALTLTEPWSLKPGQNYYVTIFGTSLVAFRVNEGYRPGDSFRLVSSHTDWPGLRIKPNPEMGEGHYQKLNVEVYGGPILNTWMDRPLSVAGKVVLRGETPFAPKVRLVDFERPMLTIPNLAIHMNREVNKGAELNPQRDMLPLMGVAKKALPEHKFFMEALGEKLQVERDEILNYELCIYNAEEPLCIGEKEDLLSAPRLDNITSVYASLRALMGSNRKQGIDVIALFDNEEIGSRTKQGAASLILTDILGRITRALGGDREAHSCAVYKSLCISCDVAHAIHPNHPEKADVTNPVYLNQGIVIKMASSQSYATDAGAISVVEALCQAGEIPYTKFLNRADMAGGSTLGSLSSSFTNMPTVDIGVPLLAMHSARELMGTKDEEAMVKLLTMFFMIEK